MPAIAALCIASHGKNKPMSIISPERGLSPRRQSRGKVKKSVWWEDVKKVRFEPF